MIFKYILYIAIILYRNYSVNADENIFRVTDRVLRCSSGLSSLIYNVCNNEYKIVKRDTSLVMEMLSPKDLQEHVKEWWLHRAAEHGRRVRRQVASECCEQPCTVATIITYCPDDAKLFKENPRIFY